MILSARVYPIIFPNELRLKLSYGFDEKGRLVNLREHFIKPDVVS